MKIDNLTPEQIISLVLVTKTTDYTEALDYDFIDWIDWANLHRN